MKKLTPHQRIIRDRFGGISRLTSLLGAYLASRGAKPIPKSTVQGWDGAGYIPARKQPLVLSVGQTLEEPLYEWEFFQLPMVARQGDSKQSGEVGYRHK